MNFSIVNISSQVISKLNELEKLLFIPIRSYSKNNTLYDKHEVIRTRTEIILDKASKTSGFSEIKSIHHIDSILHILDKVKTHLEDGVWLTINIEANSVGERKFSINLPNGDRNTDVFEYDFTIYYGDGQSENVKTAGELTHNYDEDGIYEVYMKGNKLPALKLRDNHQLTHVKSIKGLKTLDGSFSNCTNLVSFDSKGGSNIKSAISCWDSCTSLTDFNALGLVELEECELSWYGCTGLKTFNSSGLKNLKIASGSWIGCTSLETFNSSGLKNLITANGCWTGCTSLKNFDCTNLLKVTDCSRAWLGCESLTTFNTNGLVLVENCESAWSECKGLTKFNAVGLVSVTSCIDAWKNTKEWVLNGDNPTFTNYSKLLGKSGWSPTTTGNPKIS
jgi:hypothetical protein